MSFRGIVIITKNYTFSVSNYCPSSHDLRVIAVTSGSMMPPSFLGHYGSSVQRYEGPVPPFRVVGAQTLAQNTLLIQTHSILKLARCCTPRRRRMFRSPGSAISATTTVIEPEQEIPKLVRIDTPPSLSTLELKGAAPPNAQRPLKSVPMNACISILEAIGKAPLPSLRVATNELVNTIEKIEIIPSCNEGWKILTEKLCHFQYLVNLGLKCDKKLEKTLQSKLGRVDKDLRELATVLRKAHEQGKAAVQKLFAKETENDSIYKHADQFDELVDSLKDALCAKAGQNEDDLSAQLIEVSNELESDLQAANPLSAAATGAFSLIGNLAEGNKGPAFDNMKFKAGMEVKVTSNTARNNKGGAFTNFIFT